MAAETLLAACDVALRNPLVYMNAREIGDPAYARWLHRCSAARHAAAPPVLLGRYPASTLLDGQGSFQVLADGRRIDAQPTFPGEAMPATLASLRARAPGAVHVDRPCLLACRYGEWTWGHWLLDMLPKIVLAERAAPQRFTYAVPFGIVDPGVGDGYARSVLDSLAAYGVAPSRLLRIHPDHVYRCDNLFDITGAGGKRMHPGVLEAMRDVDVPALPGQGLLAVLRAPPSIRPLLNADAIRGELAGQGAHFLDPMTASFAAQVAAFRACDIVVGDLGSNLAAIVYARPRTGLVTLAPTGWQDDYFASLFQRLDVRHADVRGVCMARPGQAFHHAACVANPADLAAGLDAVRGAMATPPGAAGVALDGRMVARDTGAALAEIIFGAGGNAAAFQQSGFHAPEAHRTWSLGPGCRLALPYPNHAGPLWLEVVGSSFVSRPHLVSRLLGVSVDGVRLADFDIDDAFHVHVLVPAALLRGATLQIEFHHPVCPSPLAMGVSDDGRPLGVMFERVSLRKTSF